MRIVEANPAPSSASRPDRAIAGTRELVIAERLISFHIASPTATSILAVIHAAWPTLASSPRAEGQLGAGGHSGKCKRHAITGKVTGLLRRTEENNFSTEMETRAMIAKCRPSGSSSRRRPGRRGDGTERKLRSAALNALTTFPPGQSARVPARPARKPRRRRMFSACRPSAARLQGCVAAATDPPGRRRAAGERSAADRPNAGRPEMFPQALEKMDSAPGNGASCRDRRPASLRHGVFEAWRTGPMRIARKWRRKALRRLNPRPDMAPRWSGGRTETKELAEAPLRIDAWPFVAGKPRRISWLGSCSRSEIALQSIENIEFTPDNRAPALSFEVSAGGAGKGRSLRVPPSLIVSDAPYGGPVFEPPPCPTPVTLRCSTRSSSSPAADPGIGA